MDQNLALRLIHPLVEGSHFSSGATLDKVEVHQHDSDHRRDRVHLIFSSGLVLSIAARQSGSAAFQTTNFSVSIHHIGQHLSDGDKAVFLAVRERIAENDTEPPETSRHLPFASLDIHPDPAEIWLIPGSIGHPLDLTIRALRVLKTVDIVVIEAGSEADVEQLFDRFKLGSIPTLIAINDNDTEQRSLVRFLQQARSNEQSIALFGADEGLPTICDPGWRLMQAARQLDPPPKIKSISSGSAISTALMHTDQNQPEYLFVGLFQQSSGHSKFLVAIDRLVPLPWSNHRSMLSLAIGHQVKQEWATLVSRTRFLRGRLHLLCNLSRSDEYTRSIQLSDLSRVSPDFIASQDKVVVRIDWECHVVDFQWFLRLLRRFLTIWR